MVRGFSVLELIITLIVIGVLLIGAAPSFQFGSKKIKAQRAAQEMYALLMQTKAESILRNTPLWIHFEGLPQQAVSGGWRVKVANKASLRDPEVSILWQLAGEPFQGVELALNHPGDQIKFDHLSGMVLSSGTITLSPYSQQTGQIEIRTHSASGRIVVCQSGEMELGLGACPK